MTDDQLLPSLAAGLLPFLDIVKAAAYGELVWTAAELTTAFQWASSVRRLGSPAAAALRSSFKDASCRLPLWLGHLEPALEEQPEAVLLAALLQRPSPRPDWLALVVACYVSECVLQVPPANRAAAEAGLQRVLAHLGQQQVLGAVGAELLGQAGHAASTLATAAAVQQAGGSPRAAAVRYFLSPHTLAAAAAGHLLLLSLAAEAVSMAAFLSAPSPTPAELEVLGLAALVPTWEHVLLRLQPGGQHAAAGAGGEQHYCFGSGQVFARLLGARQAVLRQLCMLCEAQHVSRAPALGLPPPVATELCRESFQFACAFGGLLRQCGAEGGGSMAPEILAHKQHLLQYDDLVGRYLARKLHCGETKGVASEALT